MTDAGAPSGRYLGRVDPMTLDSGATPVTMWVFEDALIFVYSFHMKRPGKEEAARLADRGELTAHDLLIQTDSLGIPVAAITRATFKWSWRAGMVGSRLKITLRSGETTAFLVVFKKPRRQVKELLSGLLGDTFVVA